ncbi:MAG: DUF2516 family protein [Gordonia sp. (in: high G+C Gram-positive bacteria)]|uniref:DUF2516 family protein n=1 Tax=Gordonia sp. (in: high G+C Gram-positive bacteria) TaxID=84139 RepID=UPI0039E228E0
MTLGHFVVGFTSYLTLAIYLITALAGLVSLVHVIFTRPDAFTAIDTKSKGFWIAVLAISTLVAAFSGEVAMIFGPLAFMIFIAAMVGIIVYLVEIRPRTDEIQGKSWFRKAA